VSHSLYSQDAIRYSYEQPNTLVKLPNVYWDILSSTSGGWLLEAKNDSTKKWEGQSKTLIIKDDEGRYLTVNTLGWIENLSQWISLTNKTNEYTKNAQNLVSKIVNTTKNIPYFTANITRTHEITYDNGVPIQLFSASKDHISSSPPYTLNIYYIYNSKQQRIKDSLVAQNQAWIQVDKYEYDNQGNVIFFAGTNALQGNDTNLYLTYKYTKTNKLKQLNSFIGKPLSLSNTYDYTYNSNDQIEQLTYLYGDSAEPASQYKHYYDGKKRILAMVQRSFSSSWENVDSIAITYRPDGSYDSAFIYPGVNQTNWSSNYNRRLSFYNLLSLPVETVNKTETKIVAYPNPTSSALNISFTPQTRGSMLLSLTDIRGKQIHTEMVNCVNGVEQNTKIDISHLPSGLYFLKVGTKTLKIIKE
jgi:hypothetical protein